MSEERKCPKCGKLQSEHGTLDFDVTPVWGSSRTAAASPPAPATQPAMTDVTADFAELHASREATQDAGEPKSFSVEQWAELISDAASECESGTFKLPVDISRYIADRVAGRNNAEVVNAVHYATYSGPIRAHLQTIAILRAKVEDMTNGEGAKHIGKIIADQERTIVEQQKIIDAKWISVKDRLPEKDGRCLCVIETVSTREVDTYFFSRWFIEEYITHWMPLPQPPAALAPATASGTKGE